MGNPIHDGPHDVHAKSADGTLLERGVDVRLGRGQGIECPGIVLDVRRQDVAGDHEGGPDLAVLVALGISVSDGSGKEIAGSVREERSRRPDLRGRGNVERTAARSGAGFEGGGAVAEAGVARALELFAAAVAAAVRAGGPLDRGAVRPELPGHLHLVVAQVVADDLEAPGVAVAGAQGAGGAVAGRAAVRAGRAVPGARRRRRRPRGRDDGWGRERQVRRGGGRAPPAITRSGSGSGGSAGPAPDRAR